jgi:enoyl-CoA hydratase/carnithine racemase
MKGVERMVEEVGASNARYLFVSAKQIDADHARRIGLVHEVHSATALEEATIDLATIVSSNAPKSIRAILKMIQQTQLSTSDQNKVAIRQWINDCSNSDDYAEGLRAFVEKRTPQFRDR